SASQPFAFKVAAPITVSVNPVSGIVGQTQFTVTGTGASKNGIVDAASTFPDGTVHKFSSLADVQGNFSFGPFNQNQIGVYSEVYTDHTTGTNADPLKYTVSPSSGIPTVTGISPASPTANSATQQLTIGGSGFQAGAVVKLSTNGGTFSLGSGQVQFFSATQLQIQTILASAGLWQLQVINPSGTASTPFQFTVQPSGSTVSVAAITPA